MKDEESGGESDGEGKGNSAVAGEEADIRDVIYNLETPGLCFRCSIDSLVVCLNHDVSMGLIYVKVS